MPPIFSPFPLSLKIYVQPLFFAFLIAFAHNENLRSNWIESKIHDGAIIKSNKSLTSFRNLPSSSDSPMRVGDRRRYDIDPSKRECKLLDHHSINHYWIKKDFEANSLYLFYVSEDDKWIPDKKHDEQKKYKNQLGVARCSVGKIRNVWINSEPKNARKCGIAKILAFLCMIDQDVNPGPGISLDIDTELAGWDAAIRQVRAHCMKVVHLDMTGEHSAGFTYLSAAMMAGYSHMLVYFLLDPNYHWLETADVKKVYDDNFLDMYSRDWFFCEPKKPKPKNKPTATRIQ